LTVHSQEKYEAQEIARTRQETEEFKRLYAQRSGVEGTISQGVRKNGLRKSRYIGLPKTKLQQMATAAAINLFRIFDWIVGERPAETPVSPFVALATAAT
jgi:transposase